MRGGRVPAVVLVGVVADEGQVATRVPDRPLGHSVTLAGARSEQELNFDTTLEYRAQVGQWANFLSELQKTLPGHEDRKALISPSALIPRSPPQLGVSRSILRMASSRRAIVA